MAPGPRSQVGQLASGLLQPNWNNCQAPQTFSCPVIGGVAEDRHNKLGTGLQGGQQE